MSGSYKLGVKNLASATAFLYAASVMLLRRRLAR